MRVFHSVVIHKKPPSKRCRIYGVASEMLNLLLWDVLE